MAFQLHGGRSRLPPTLAAAAEEPALLRLDVCRRRGPAGAGGPARTKSSFGQRAPVREDPLSYEVARLRLEPFGWPRSSDPDMDPEHPARQLSAFRLLLRGTLSGGTFRQGPDVRWVPGAPHRWPPP